MRLGRSVRSAGEREGQGVSLEMKVTEAGAGLPLSTQSKQQGEDDSASVWRWLIGCLYQGDVNLESSFQELAYVGLHMGGESGVC